MSSPFPGMDPYLEGPEIWGDFHTTTLVAMRAALNAQLPRNYLARVDRYVWLHEPSKPARRRLGKPDLLTIEESRVSGESPVAVLHAPSQGTLPVHRRQGTRYLRIVDRRDRRVVTVIELLSPANKKPGKDRESYLAKRDEFLAAGTNLVEIDLLRRWPRMPMGEPPPPKSDYCIFVCRSIDFPRSNRWPFNVRDAIPLIAIPLNAGDPIVELDLKPCLERAYEEGSYGDEIEYGKPPTPPLSRIDAAWAKKLLASPRR